MKFFVTSALLLALAQNDVDAFSSSRTVPTTTAKKQNPCTLFVSIGIGPKETDEDEERELIPGVDYEIPDHEAYRTSRRTKLDERCDAWYEKLLGTEEDIGMMGSLAHDARTLLLTPVELVNDLPLPKDHEEWTPYVTTKLPWTPLTPAFGLEQFGIPVPRRNAETWRHFDVPGMIKEDYSGSPEGIGTPIELTDEQVAEYTKKLQEQGGWLPDDACRGRLVYINGRFVPQLSMTNDVSTNLDNLESASDEVKNFLARLTDGFTDELAAPVPDGDKFRTSFKKLSGPDHKMGDPTTQFAINAQQGTACFAALNTIRTGSVAYVHVPKGTDAGLEVTKPFLIVNAVTKSAGNSNNGGVAFHPRCLVVAEEESQVAIVQSCVDLDLEDEAANPKFYNGYTQMFIKSNANVTHSYIEESGGIVTPAVELSDDQIEEGDPLPRSLEAMRPELRDTHLEAIDVHCMGDDAAYKGAVMSIGGTGRIRIAHSTSLLRPGSDIKLSGFALSGGAQRTDMKTNIHHIAQGTTSEQIQKNMIGGRATGSFRGRVRVEQSAQQTDSQQLSRTVLLTDRCTAWAVPSLEIVADDVKCTHGATVSDLSEEELFYLRSRGLDRTLARNMLMFGFADEVCSAIHPAMFDPDYKNGIVERVTKKLFNMVPRGDRAIMGEFQSV